MIHWTDIEHSKEGILQILDVIKNSIKSKQVSEDEEEDEDEDDEKPIARRKEPAVVKKVVVKPSIKPITKKSTSIKPIVKPTIKPTVKPSAKPTKVSEPQKSKAKISDCSPSALMIAFIEWSTHKGNEAMVTMAKGFEDLTGFKCKDIASKFVEMPKVLNKDKKYRKLLDRISKSDLAKLGKKAGLSNISEVADYVTKYM
mgnify:CR=1 FL=1